MNGETWYQLPARLLREGAGDGQIATAIERAGPKPVSHGASTDAEGNHFFTDLANNAITKLDPVGRLQTLVQDDRLLWPDALSFGEPGWLYIAVNMGPIRGPDPYRGPIRGPNRIQIHHRFVPRRPGAIEAGRRDHALTAQRRSRQPPPPPGLGSAPSCDRIACAA
jgi:hypothetical protein